MLLHKLPFLLPLDYIESSLELLAQLLRHLPCALLRLLFFLHIELRQEILCEALFEVGVAVLLRRLLVLLVAILVERHFPLLFGGAQGPVKCVFDLLPGVVVEYVIEEEVDEEVLGLAHLVLEVQDLQEMKGQVAAAEEVPEELRQVRGLAQVVVVE